MVEDGADGTVENWNCGNASCVSGSIGTGICSADLNGGSSVGTAANTACGENTGVGSAGGNHGSDSPTGSITSGFSLDRFPKRTTENE